MWKVVEDQTDAGGFYVYDEEGHGDSHGRFATREEAQIKADELNAAK